VRILHFLPSLSAEAGGPARAVLDLCRALATAGHEVTLASANLGEVAHEWEHRPSIAGLRLVQAPIARLPAFTYLHRQLNFFAELLGEHDVLHVHGIWEYGNIQISRLAAAMGRPYIVSVHGMLGSWPMRQNGTKKRLFLRLVGLPWLLAAESVHFTAQAEREEAMKRVSVRRSVVIPNLLDLEPYHSLPPAADAESALQLPSRENPRVLFLSRIHPVKGLDTLLHAVALLKKSGRPVSLIVAGDGQPAYVREMKALTARLGLGSNVVFTGMVTGNLKLSLFQSCDLLAIPTKHENFGIVFVEALACGLPVLTTPDVGIRTELEASGAAVIVDPTAMSFAAAIGDALVQTPHTATARESGRLWVFKWLSAQALVPRFISSYGGERFSGGADDNDVVRPMR
jgi:glycosyltransferase involved in cell wall biosynthesis